MQAEGRLHSELRMGFYTSVGAAVGWAAWGRSESLSGLLGLLLLPLMWGKSRTRWEGLALMLGYYLAGARGLPKGAVVFFGDTAPPWWGWAMWLGVSILLTMPFVLCWSRFPLWRAAGFALAILVCVVPPLGIVGWLNPLSVAGVLLPAAGWPGLMLTMALFFVLVFSGDRLVIGLIVAMSVSFYGRGADVVADKRWLGFDTSFAKLSSAGTNQSVQLIAAMQRIEWLNGVIVDMPANATLVLPETVIGRLDGVARGLLDHAEGELVAKNSKVLVGAELPGDGEQYLNAVVVLGAKGHESRAAVQGIPVPIAMWKPWASDGARADLLARGNTITVGGHRVGVTICYEHLLAYSLLQLMWDKPDLIAAVSNVWWARTTNIPRIQFQSVHAFARLFGVPVVSARNM